MGHWAGVAGETRLKEAVVRADVSCQPEARSLPTPPDGVVVVGRRDGEGWRNVAVGRRRRVFRFNLSDPEARQIRDQLCAELGPPGT
jgi:hypothetical protein